MLRETGRALMAMVTGKRGPPPESTSASSFAVAVLLAWSLMPIYWIAVTSLKPEKEIYALPPTLFPAAPTLAHYATVLFKTRFPLFVRQQHALVATCSPRWPAR